MRTSTVSAAFLLVGAGAAALAALEPGGGNNLALNGSDTLFEVTQSVITSCGTQFGDFTGDKISYLGGGSGVGSGQMDLGLQEMSPMSRALKSNEYCTNVSNTSINATALSEGAANGNTFGLLVGIDGVAITANQASDCQADTAANPSGAAIPFGSTTPFAVTVPTGGVCNGCSASNTYTFGDSSVSTNLYKNQPSFDALAVIYFGLTHDGFYNCTSNVRKSLVSNWGALFNTTCGASSSTGACTTGLQHAWRRSDLSGTTDAFVSVINPPNGSATNGKGAGVSVGIGTLSNVPSASQKSNPFCNSADANPAPGANAAVSFGGSSDFSDLDPIRITAVPSDNVAERFSGGTTTSKFKGDLGLVTVILLPDGTSTVGSDEYPTAPCSNVCALFPIAKNTLVGQTTCPNGSLSYAGSCFFPTVAGSNPPDPRCVSVNTTTCVDTNAKSDGRIYNLVTWAESANAGNKKAGATFQWAFDANNRFMSGSFYRVRGSTAADPGATGHGMCVENDDTLDIGCLSDANPCSIGYAGRASSATFPDTGGTGTQNTVKALALNGGLGYVPPFTPASVGTDPDLFLENLLQSSGTLYPLARRLWVSSLYGTSNMGGGEAELLKCYGTATIANAAVSGNGFVPVPASTDNLGHALAAGPQCIDYPETLVTTGTPAPNIQGVGAVALGGCGASGTPVDACQQASSQPVDIHGAAVQEAQ